jgi:formamidopyrimidine-DNA glycosylase
MPELPEVETIKRELAPYLVGRCFSRVVLNWPRAVRHPSAKEFARRLQGRRVEGIARRGKFLLLDLSGGESLVLHLKMSGSLLVKPASATTDKHTRTVFYLGNGRPEESSLHFRDPRKFGAMWLVKDKSSITGQLGPEPLSPRFTMEALAAILKGHRLPIKALLCDQSRLAGLGNMYADEALFAARIHPLRAAGELSSVETKRLHRAIRQVLRRGIRDCGASVSTYSRPDGSLGWAHEYFKVAHRGGQPCPRCGTSIQRLPLRGRGSYFCPRCQKP